MSELIYRVSPAALYEVAALLHKRDGIEVPVGEVMKALADIAGDESLSTGDPKEALGTEPIKSERYEECDECGGTGEVWVGESETLVASEVAVQLRALAQQAELAQALGFSEVPA